MELTSLTCPECGGVIMKSEDGSEYECQVGHKYSAMGFLYNQNQTIEAALWKSLRILKERNQTLKNLSEQKELDPPQFEIFREHATHTSQNISALQELINRELKDMAEEEPTAQRKGPLQSGRALQ